MHPRYLTLRDEEAQARIEAVTKSLGEFFGLPEDLVAKVSVTERDPEIRSMLRREGVADVLAALSEAHEATAKELDDALRLLSEAIKRETVLETERDGLKVALAQALADAGAAAVDDLPAENPPVPIDPAPAAPDAPAPKPATKKGS